MNKWIKKICKLANGVHKIIELMKRIKLKAEKEDEEENSRNNNVWIEDNLTSVWFKNAYFCRI